MNLLKIAMKVAETIILPKEAIELMTPFNEESKLNHNQFEIELERENLAIDSPALKALIDPTDTDGTWDGVPTYHTIEIGDIDISHEPADRSVGIMGESYGIEDFQVIGIDGYAVNAEDSKKLKSAIGELTEKEIEQLIQRHMDSLADFDNSMLDF